MSENAMAIRNALGVERLAEHLYRSGYWSDARSQSQAIVKVLRGAELDIGPISSMDGVYVIEGKTSLSATLLGSLIQRSERYRYRVVEHDDEHCVIDFYEIVDGVREPLGTSKFDMEDARKAGLLGKRGQMWEKYPRNMVFSRALSNGARWYTPDVFSGPVYTPDELGAEVDESGQVVSYTPTREREVVDVSPAPQPSQITDQVWNRWVEVRDEGLKYGVDVPSLARQSVGYQQLVSIATAVKDQTDDKKDRLAQEEAARAAARAQQETQPGLPSGSDYANSWERNRALMAECYAQGIKLPELPNDATPEQVAERNLDLQQRLLSLKG
jgi:hypothetical protein